MSIEERIAKYEEALKEWDEEIGATERDEDVSEMSDAEYHGLHERFTS
jgi:hypothetical protein